MNNKSSNNKEHVIKVFYVKKKIRNICKPMAVSFQCMTKFTTNKKKKKEKKRQRREKKNQK